MNVPSWLLIVLVSIATCQLTETFRHGSLFASTRARIEARGPFWSELIGCGFCFSHWAAAMAVLMLVGHLLVRPYAWRVDPFLVVLVWLNAIRLANLLNDMTKSRSRSPSGDDLDLGDLELNDDDPLESQTPAGPTSH